MRPLRVVCSLNSTLRRLLIPTAGITLQDIAGSNTSVFAGCFFRDYYESLLRDPDSLPRFFLLGIGATMASNRLSHFFDLRGPSMTVDTGCSTTLTALHQACQSLRTGESDMSIVGGANVIFNPDMFMAMSSMTCVQPRLQMHGSKMLTVSQTNRQRWQILRL
jgi:Polyketide synthase modules and related proteins